MSSMDKEQINRRIVEVCEHYLGSGRGGGDRRAWTCPQCRKTNFRVNGNRRIGGCFSAGCPVPDATDAIGLIGYFEDLGDYGREFFARLEKGYDILGLREPAEEAVRGSQRNTDSTAAHQPAQHQPDAGGAAPTDDTRQKMRWMAGKGPRESLQAGTEGVHPANGATKAPDQPTKRMKEQPLEAYMEGPDGLREAIEVVAVEEIDEESYLRETADAVYRRILELCPIGDRDLRFWASRGVSAETVERGKFGSLSAKRHHELVEQLKREFGTEDLLCVSGFYKTQQGQLSFNLFGDYTLIPYHDARGLVTIIEGRVPGEPREDEAKYKALLDSGSHLYVFPDHRPREIVAICEGAIGAVVAAQSGIPVASIKGFRAHRSWSGGGYGPLPELRGVDFGGRRVVYIPDTDVKPHVRTEVEQEAPRACEWLISRQNGRPAMAQLPEGYKDLDEWLLSLPAGERVEAFAELVREAVSPQEWLEQKQSAGQVVEGSPGSTSTTSPEAVPKPQPKVQHNGWEGADEQDTTQIPVAENRNLKEEDDTIEIPTIGAENAETENEKGTPTPAAPESETQKQGGGADEDQNASPKNDDAGVSQAATQLQLAGEEFFGNSNQHSGGSYTKRNARRNRVQRGAPEIEPKPDESQTEDHSTGSDTTRAPSEDESSEEGQQKEGVGNEQGSSGVENEPANGPSEPITGEEEEPPEKRPQRPMRPSQAKWYATLERTPRYRPPEEKKQKPAQEPGEPPSDHVRPDYVNYGELVISVVLILTCAGLWLGSEYMWPETLLSSPLGWFGPEIRWYFYCFTAYSVGFGIWLWGYKRRRRKLIDHLLGRKKKR